MEILLARMWFEGRSCVTPTLCIEQGVQKASVKGVFFKLAGPLKDPEASKAGYFLLAFLACWPRQDQHCSLAHKVPHENTRSTRAVPSIFFPFSVWVWHQKRQHQLPRTASNSLFSFQRRAVSQTKWHVHFCPISVSWVSHTVCYYHKHQCWTKTWATILVKLLFENLLL